MRSICKYPDCGRFVHSRGLCGGHRLRRNVGDGLLDIWKYSAYAKEKFDTPATTERLLTMNEIVEALARGYGVEDAHG